MQEIKSNDSFYTIVEFDRDGIIHRGIVDKESKVIIEPDSSILEIIDCRDGNVFIKKRYVDEEVEEGIEHCRIDKDTKNVELAGFFGPFFHLLDTEQKTAVVSNVEPGKEHQRGVYDYDKNCFLIGEIWLDAIGPFEQHEGSYYCALATVNLRGGTTIKKTDPLVQFYIASDGSVVSDAYVTPMGEFGDYSESTMNATEELLNEQDLRKTVPEVVEEAQQELDAHLKRSVTKIKELKPYSVKK